MHQHQTKRETEIGLLDRGARAREPVDPVLGRFVTQGKNKISKSGPPELISHDFWALKNKNEPGVFSSHSGETSNLGEEKNS